LRASGCEAIEGGARRRVLSCDFVGAGAKEKSDVLSMVIAGAIVRDVMWLFEEKDLFGDSSKFASRAGETPLSGSSVGSKEWADQKNEGEFRVELVFLEPERSATSVCLWKRAVYQRYESDKKNCAKGDYQCTRPPPMTNP
jgi:hypothetical protein